MELSVTDVSFNGWTRLDFTGQLNSRNDKQVEELGVSGAFSIRGPLLDMLFFGSQILTSFVTCKCDI